MEGTILDDDIRHSRTMNLNAHFAWGFALWASAEELRTSGNFILAPVGYYYSCFHSGYAYLNAIPGIEPSTFDRMGHQQLSNLIEQHLNNDLRAIFDEMRELREIINYLGFNDPASKLGIMRGKTLRFGDAQQSQSFENKIIEARDKSRNFIISTLDEVRSLSNRAVDRIPRRGDNDEDWLQEYMQEDIYLNIMSNGMRANTVRFIRELLS